MSDKEYLTAKVDADSPIYEQFQTVIEEEGYESNSEAVRALVRDGLKQRNQQGDERRADTPLTAILAFAEREIPLQVRALGWMLTFAGAMLTFFEMGVIGGPVWLVAGGFFGFVALTNLFGILSPLATYFLPETEAGNPAESSDEVDA